MRVYMEMFCCRVRTPLSARASENAAQRERKTHMPAEDLVFWQAVAGGPQVFCQSLRIRR